MRDNSLGYILQRHATGCQKVHSLLHELCAVGKHAWLPAIHNSTCHPICYSFDTDSSKPLQGVTLHARLAANRY